MDTILCISLGLCATLTMAKADPRSSSSYAITCEVADHGGRATSSASYSGSGCMGGTGGVSSTATPAQTVKHGYLGQLHDVTGFALTSSASPVNEGTTFQLGARQLLHDGTYLVVNAASVSWSAPPPPIAEISPGGLATTTNVYQNAATTLSGTYGGFTGTLHIEVINLSIDDFGSYAADGIDDAWQVQYFGTDNPNAGPGVDFTGTGRNNSFKYIAGLNPVDRTAPNSVFSFKVEPVPDPSSPGGFVTGRMRLIFGPCYSDRVYKAVSSTDLSANLFIPVPNQSQPGESGAERIVTDFQAAGPRKFYRIEITKP